MEAFHNLFIRSDQLIILNVNNSLGVLTLKYQNNCDLIFIFNLCSSDCGMGSACIGHLRGWFKIHLHLLKSELVVWDADPGM